MALVADQDDLVAILGVALAFLVHLGNQGAGRVEHRQVAAVGVVLDLLGHAMGAEHRDRALRDLVHLLDEARALRLQAFDDPLVVNDFVADIDRRPVDLQRPLDDLNRAFHPGAKSAWLG